jgi:hypothetical protein
VLNGANPPSKATDADADPASDSSTSNSPWVIRNDRHRQLINASVYEKDAKARTLAIEQTRLQARTARDKRERAKLMGHFRRVADTQGSTNSQDPYEVIVDGVRFLVTKNGSKLIKAPGEPHPGRLDKQGNIAHSAHHRCSTGDNNSAKATPKMAVVAGVKFYRSKNGNLYRHGLVKAQRYVSPLDLRWPLTSDLSRRTGTVKKVDVPCKEFSTTGTSQHFRARAAEKRRTPWSRDVVRMSGCTNHKLRILGSCRKGPNCRYQHNPERVAACKDFLQKGECINGDACDLSHDLTPERTPTCLHFAKDHCTNPNCRYAHVKVSPGAPVCRSFGFFGYCKKGAECEDRHAFECPDFSNTGVCKTKGCKLLHRERASVLRKNGATTRDKSSEEDQEMEDVSSDDDGDSIDSNDVDSDEVEEFIGEEDGWEFEQQKDFIRF